MSMSSSVILDCRLSGASSARRCGVDATSSTARLNESTLRWLSVVEAGSVEGAEASVRVSDTCRRRVRIEPRSDTSIGGVSSGFVAVLAAAPRKGKEPARGRSDVRKSAVCRSAESCEPLGD